MVERLGLTESGLADTIVATVSYADINAGDMPSVSTTFHHFNYKNAAGVDVTGSLNGLQLADINKVVSAAHRGAGSRPEELRYGVRRPTTWRTADFDFLAAGETLVLTYQAKVDNNYTPNNLSTIKTFTIIITGTNDVPVITSTVAGHRLRRRHQRARRTADVDLADLGHADVR